MKISKTTLHHDPIGPFCCIHGHLPHPHHNLIQVHNRRDAYRFHLTLTIPQKPNGSLLPYQYPFQQTFYLGVLPHGQYCIIVNGDEENAKWFGVD